MQHKFKVKKINENKRDMGREKTVENYTSSTRKT